MSEFKKTENVGKRAYLVIMRTISRMLLVVMNTDPDAEVRLNVLKDLGKKFE